MPSDARRVYQHEVQLASADLYLVDGLIHDAGAQAREYADRNECFDLSTFKEPYRLEGKKTLGFELLEQLEWHFPTVIVYPTGGGTGLVGMWKAFQELLALGWVDGELPRMVSVQAEGCAPVVRAIEAGTDRIRNWENAVTDAHGLRVPSVFADRLVLQAIRESNGTGIAVSDEEIRVARRDLAAETGVLPCLEGAATLAGLRRLRETSWLDSNDRVVLYNTGSGLKDLA
jgi:threonine synthase